ncbi:unnamed protein product [Tilletia controversa]|nr:unnamed protein product [Tilletia controversa]
MVPCAVYLGANMTPASIDSFSRALENEVMEEVERICYPEEEGVSSLLLALTPHHCAKHVRLYKLADADYRIQTEREPIMTPFRLGQGLREGIEITLSLATKEEREEGGQSVHFSLATAHYVAEGLKADAARFPCGGRLRIVEEEGRGSTAFAAHANQATWDRYGGIEWRVEVDGLPGQIFPVVIRAMRPSMFVVGGVGRHLHKTRSINKLLRLLEAVKLTHAVDTARPFALRPWASGYPSDRQPVWEPSGRGNGGRMTLISVDEDPVEPRLSTSFPTSNCANRDLMLRALLEGTQRASVHFAPGQHSPLILKVCGISLLIGHQVEWVIEEFGIHIAEVIARLKEDNHNTEFDMWAKMGWSWENGVSIQTQSHSNYTSAVRF